MLLTATKWFLKIAQTHSQSSIIYNIFAYGKLPGCSMAVQIENITSVKEANTRVILAKRVVTVVWNCEIHSAAERQSDWQ